jgi:hypothetical protein
LKPESKGGGAVLNLDLAVGVGMIISVKPQERCGLERNGWNAMRWLLTEKGVN